MKAKVMQEGDTALQNFERTMKSVFATPNSAWLKGDPQIIL
jgi:hypothetical protein